jgi:cyclase
MTEQVPTFRIVVRAGFLLCSGAALMFAQQSAPASASTAQTSAELHLLKVRDNVYMLVGAGGNITLQIGRNGVLMVDAGLAPMAEKVYAEIRKLTDQPLRYIIDTHVHPDHVGGNEFLAKKGSTIAGGNVVGNIGESAAEGATVVAHEKVMNRMSDSQPPVPFGALPTDTYFVDKKELFFNGEAIQLFHQPAAHTDGDTIVFFRRSDVVSTGDIFTPDRYPVIDLARGGNVQGIVDGLNLILDLTVPEDKQEGGTMVVPGHGRLCDEADVVEYRDMMTIIRDRFQDMIHKGMTLEQVKAAKPTRDYDPQYGSDKGFWTTDMFIEAVYKSLKK